MEAFIRETQKWSTNYLAYCCGETDQQNNSKTVQTSRDDQKVYSHGHPLRHSTNPRLISLSNTTKQFCNRIRHGVGYSINRSTKQRSEQSTVQHNGVEYYNGGTFSAWMLRRCWSTTIYYYRQRSATRALAAAAPRCPSLCHKRTNNQQQQRNVEWECGIVCTPMLKFREERTTYRRRQSTSMLTSTMMNAVTRL